MIHPSLIPAILANPRLADPALHQEYVVINARTGVQVGGKALPNVESAKFQACWHTAWNMEPGPYVILEKVTDGE